MNTADIPVTKSRKFSYTDNISLATKNKDLSHAEPTLTDDLNVLKDYFGACELNPKPTKTSEVSYYHLNNRPANLMVTVYFDAVKLEHNEHPEETK